MSFIKHLLRAIREPFGTAGLVVAMIALVAALGGSALAAAKLNSSQKKEVEKIAKKFAGRPGTAGPAGPTGPAGPAGPVGPAGKEGAQGKEGVAGRAGKKGTTGFTETLPPGETETGTWSITAAPGAEEGLRASFSFPIPLSEEVAAEYVTTPSPGCPGSAAFPAAEPGHFCIYPAASSMSFTGLVNLAHPEVPSESSKFGMLAAFVNESSTESGYAFGSWAVTAGE